MHIHKLFSTVARSEACILGSLKSRRRIAYRYIIMLALSLKFPKKHPAKTLKMPLSTTRLSFDAPPQETPTNMCINLIPGYCQKVESLTYIFVADSIWVYLHSNLCGLKDASFLQYQPSKWSKVVDFGTNRKGVSDFLLVINSNFGQILHHFWDTATYWLNIVNFSYPTLI